MKICTRCHINKEDSEFRTRQKNGYDYLNPTCRLCDNSLAKERNNKKRNDEIYKQKQRERAKAYARNNKDLINEKNRIKRSTPEYKKHRKEYEKKKRAEIREQSRERKKAWFVKHRDSISNTYVINLLHTQGYGTIEEICKNFELIELKRVQILKRRIQIEILNKKRNVKKND